LALSRRLGGVLLAAATAAVVTAAVVDAIRKDTRQPKRAGVTSAPARGRLGTLYYVDRHCKLHAVTVPALRPAAAPRDSGCSALVSPSTPAPGWSVWPSTAHLAAWCDGNRVLVAAASGLRLPLIGGCAPAWRPDGSLTYIRRGTIVEFPRTGRAQDLLTAAQVASALGKGWRADRLAWLGPDRVAVAASNNARAVLAVFDGKQVVARIPVEPGLDLRASPHGSFVVARGANGLRIYDARLRRLDGSGADTAIAWSPDEHWRAVATRRRVVLSSTAMERVVLPSGALDLAWTR
jgi:hypothetical protein